MLGAVRRALFAGWIFVLGGCHVVEYSDSPDGLDAGTDAASDAGPVCGDGVVDTGEVCDDGLNDGSYGGCKPDCSARGPYCGDDEVNGDETCDDGNTDDDDECGAGCSVYHPCFKGVFEGDFTVENPEDLANLAGHTEVTGILNVHGTELANLDGLDCLASVGALKITDNSSLADLEGLIGLTTIVGDAVEMKCCEARSVGGNLIRLVEYEGESAISYNPALTDLNGLRNLASVDVLTISSNGALTSLQGLGNLAEIHTLIIAANDSLLSLKGLGSLTYIPWLTIKDNPSLISLEGLDDITSMLWIHVLRNESLTSLAGLGSLTDLSNVFIPHRSSKVIG